MKPKSISQLLGGIAVLLLSSIVVVDNVMAASATNQADVRVVMAIGIANLTGLSFGEVSSSPLPGSVTVLPDNSVIRRGGLVLGGSAEGGAAAFQLSGASNTTFSIRLPSSVALTSASGERLLVNNIQSFPRVTGELDSHGSLVLRVGGVLEVGGMQSPGVYTGLMSVSVDYN